MLSSWFGQKSSDSGGARPSTDFQKSTVRASASTATELHPASPPADKQVKRTFSPVTTPHDAVLAELQGRTDLNSQKHADGEPSPELSPRDDGQRPRPYLSPELGPSPTSSGHTTPRPPAWYHSPPPPPPEFLHDPFDGSSMGMLVPQDPNFLPDDHIHPVEEKTEEMWLHLSKVLDLQSQIAKMHLEMEGIGSGKAGDTKSKGKAAGRTGATGRSVKAKPIRLASTLSYVGEMEGDPEHDVDEEGVGIGDEEAEKNRAREAEFAKLADQFEGRKESINDIMGKLDDLSKALTEFHALQVPRMEFPSSRHGSIGVTSPTTPPDSGNTGNISPTKSKTLPSIVYSPPLQPNAGPSGIIPRSLSRSNPPQPKPRPFPIPSLIVELDKGSPQQRVFESPASTLGSLKLPPEE